MAVNRVPRSFGGEGRVRESGIYIAKVKDVSDARRMGRISVWIPELGGNPEDRDAWIVASYASPFAGATNVRDVRPDSQAMEGSQQSYGFWMVPPDLENEVLVCFSDGDTARCFWFACLYQEQMNHMVPGIAAGRTTDPNWTASETTAGGPPGAQTPPRSGAGQGTAPATGGAPGTPAPDGLARDAQGNLYNPNFYRTLGEAQEGAQRYASALEFARASPQNYTPDQIRAIERLKAAADANVARLSGTATPTQPPAPPAGTPATTTGERQSVAMNFFAERGYSADQAAALVANLQRASDLSPTRGTDDDGSTGVGIGGWAGERLAAITERFGKSPAEMSLEEQLAAVDWELRDSPLDSVRQIGTNLLQSVEGGISSLTGLASNLFGGVLGSNGDVRETTENLANALVARTDPAAATPQQRAEQAAPTVTAPQTVAQQAARPGGTDGRVAPVVEYNKANVDSVQDPRRPVFRPLAEGLMRQGLNSDTERGIASTSARREAPSKVFGFLTPRGNTMHVDDDEENEFIRLRTRSGVGITIHETTGYVYIVSKNGNSWLEISDAGIDLYTDNSFSVHAAKNINFRAGQNILLDAGNMLSMRSANGLFLESGKAINVRSGQHLVLNARGNLALRSGNDMLLRAAGNHRTQGGGDVSSLAGGQQIRQGSQIQDNSAAAPSTGDITTAIPSAQSQGGVSTTVSRLPTREPWSGHPRRDVPTGSSGSNPQGGRPDGGGFGPDAANNQRVRTGEGENVDVPRNTLPRCFSGARTAPVSTDVFNSIREASDRTGMDFGLMMAVAHQESGFNPNARARTSSATGLYQFIDGTWTGMVTRHGAQFNISANDRLDPRANALMGAQYMRNNADHLRRNGIETNNTNIYMAHFLGAGGATSFLRENNRNPDRSAAELFPQAAAANRPIFYNRDGSPRTIGQVRAFMEQKIEPRAQAYSAQAGQPAPCERDGSRQAPTVTAGTGGGTPRPT
jgi:hypothetical protein